MTRPALSDSCREITTHTHTLHQLQQQRNDKQFCDVTLRVENETFNAHRNVLAAVSEYFLKMFTVDMKEKYNQVIPIQSVTARAAKEILNSIYTGKMVLSEDSLTEILHAASMMQVTDVISAVTCYMGDNLSVSNYYFFKDLATLYSFEDLLESIDRFLLQNIVEISNKDRFLELSLNDIEEILKSDDVNVVDEENAFKIALKWINKDLENRKQYFPQLFKHVRLQFISITHVVDIIAQNEFVRGFTECRDLIEKTFSFHINPSCAASQKPRTCFGSQLDALLFFFTTSIPITEKIIVTGKTYNLKSKQWTNLQSWSQNILQDCAVANHHSAWFFCGGIVSKASTSSQVIKFDGIRWMTLPSLNIDRCGAAAVFQGSKLYVFGGETTPIQKNKMYHNANVGLSVLHFAKSFECLNEGWEQTDHVGQVRSYFSAQAIDEKIYLIGGYKPLTIQFRSHRISYSQMPKIICKDTFCYLPRENTWETCGQLNVARAAFACAVHQSSIYVVGGYSDGELPTRSVEFKNQHDNTWTLCPTLIAMLGPASACFVENKMYVASKCLGEVVILVLKKNDVEEVNDSELQGKDFSKIYAVVPFADKLC